MLDFSVTFLITIVNITFLFIVLKKVLFGPVTKFMEDRTLKIKRDIDSAKNSADRAATLEAEYGVKLKAIDAEAQKILQAARERAKQDYNTILSDAKAETARMIDTARIEIENERRESKSALLRETADISILAASRVIRENLDSGKNRELVEAFLETAGAS
jgi:F-type H+-transporting ATPase subunit b